MKIRLAKKNCLSVGTFLTSPLSILIHMTIFVLLTPWLPMTRLSRHVEYDSLCLWKCINSSNYCTKLQSRKLQIRSGKWNHRFVCLEPLKWRLKTPKTEISHFSPLRTKNWFQRHKIRWHWYSFNLMVIHLPKCINDHLEFLTWHNDVSMSRYAVKGRAAQ